MPSLRKTTVAMQTQPHRATSFFVELANAVFRRLEVSFLKPPYRRVSAGEMTMFPQGIKGAPALILLNWRPFVRRSLRGFASVRYEKLDIQDVSLHVQGDKRWCALPAKPLLQGDGAAIRNPDGRFRYTSILAWSTKEAAEFFSRWIIAEVERVHPDALTPE